MFISLKQGSLMLTDFVKTFATCNYISKQADAFEIHKFTD